MIINKSKKIIIDLTGPEGNIFVLFGYVRQFVKNFDMDYEKIIEEMKSSDYDNAIKVFDKYFGNFVILLK